MVKFNYEIDENNQIVSVTTHPLDTNKPIMTLSEVDFEDLCHAMVANAYAKMLKKYPDSPFLKAKVDASNN